MARGLSVVGRRAGITAVLLLLVSSSAFAIVPLASAPAKVLPASASPAAAAAGDSFEVLRTVPVEHLGEAAEQLLSGKVHDVKAPDTLPGYASWPEEAKRSAWIFFTISAAHEADHPISGKSPISRKPESESKVATASSAASGAKGGHDMTELWALESHGYPDRFFPAEDGASFLVTSDAFLRFPAPGAPAAWMVKPNSYIDMVDTEDANGDGNKDIVASLQNWDIEDILTEPSLVVLDGVTGATITSGLVAEQAFYYWTLTDVDGDGRRDLLGLNAELEIQAADLNGKILYTRALDVIPQIGALFVYMFYIAPLSFGFVDVNGDGTLDVVTTDLIDLVTIVPYGWLNVPVVVAYDGRDGSMIWRAPTGTASSTAYSFFVDGADVDGDGMGDVLLQSMTAGPLQVTFEMSVSLLSGEDGGVLSADRSGSAAFQSYGGLDYYPLGLANLDGTGSAEIVGVRASAGEVETYSIVGRTLGLRGAETTEIYEIPLDLGKLVVADGVLKLRDVDSDGDPELVIHFFAFEMADEEVTALRTPVITVGGGKATTLNPPGLLGLYDLDGTYLYGWSLEKDLWGKLDLSGAPLGGLPIITDIYPWAAFDVDGDKVKDQLMKKTFGFTWFDGATGQLLRDIPRPTDRFALAAEAGRGGVQALEVLIQGGIVLTDLSNTKEVGRLDRDAFGEDRDWGVYDFGDANGDGNLDLLIVAENEKKGEEDLLQIYDLAGKRVLWTLEEPSGFPMFVDMVASRAGDEVVFYDSGWTITCDSQMCQIMEDDPAVSMFSPPATKPIYSVKGSEGAHIIVDDGVLVLLEASDGSEGAKTGLTFFDAATGKEAATVDLGDTEWGAGVMVLEGGKRPYVATISEPASEDSDESDVPRVQADVFTAAGAPVATFFPEARLVSTKWGDFPVFPWFQDAVGDWDGDGRDDFAMYESKRTLIRGAKGDVIATSQPRLWVESTEDATGDGKGELTLIGPNGRLVLAGHSKGTVLPAAADGAVRTIEDPQSPNEKGSAKGTDANDIPGFEVGLVALALLGLGIHQRRRV